VEKIPQEYIIQKFYQYAGYPKFKKISNVYEAGCPSCREGSSWGRKRRLYYIIDDNAICCHNCGWYGNPFKWIMETGQLQAFEIYAEIEENDYGYIDLEKDDNHKKFNKEHMPKDSVNLFDNNQLSYYKNNDIIKKALSYIKKRRLETAVNRCQDLWLSLDDFIHKNRIIIPFYDENNKIIHYQSRGLINSDLKTKPKYLSKLNSDKSLFNYNQIDSSMSDIFIFEGPIDAFFVKNSIATAGIQENSTKSFSSLQQKQIDRLWLTNKIWVLDSQWQDQASLSKTKKLIQQGHTVFIWPKRIGQEFKDFNEMACHYEIDEISPQFIKKNSYKGMKADVILTQIK
jgi:hypothetical protein